MFGPRKGVLPKQLLQELMTREFIKDVDASLLNPASIDLPLSEEAYKIPCVFQLGKGEHVRTVLEVVGKEPHDLEKPLEVGETYIIRIAGTWNLPQNVYAYANPKSTAGRVNLFARVMADNVEMY
ncbi:MAG TPA: 2'-deoxycytidine 5'-triphosphate deaminase, partial [Candidatus Paceibacterota bacterium]|nr:2'-deoxycytidine 5'-triphosphate deaminase [Candidatus Paceibacterota bacterium]